MSEKPKVFVCLIFHCCKKEEEKKEHCACYCKVQVHYVFDCQYRDLWSKVHKLKRQIRHLKLLKCMWLLWRTGRTGRVAILQIQFLTSVVML